MSSKISTLVLVVLAANFHKSAVVLAQQPVYIYYSDYPSIIPSVAPSAVPSDVVPTNEEQLGDGDGGERIIDWFDFEEAKPVENAEDPIGAAAPEEEEFVETDPVIDWTTEGVDELEINVDPVETPSETTSEGDFTEAVGVTEDIDEPEINVDPVEEFEEEGAGDSAWNEAVSVGSGVVPVGPVRMEDFEEAQPAIVPIDWDDGDGTRRKRQLRG